MHDLKTIQRINAEEFKAGDRVRVVKHEDEDMVGREGIFVRDDDQVFYPLHVLLDSGDGLDFFARGELERVESPAVREATPQEVTLAHSAALDVLEAHAIKPFWQRSGYQIRELLVEAILTERGLIKPEA